MLDPPPPPPPISGKWYIPHVSGIGYHWQLHQKYPLSRAFSEIFPRLRKNPPLSRENGNTHAAPYVFEWGLGGGGYGSTVFIISLIWIKSAINTISALKSLRRSWYLKPDYTRSLGWHEHTIWYQSHFTLIWLAHAFGTTDCPPPPKI